MKYYATYNCYSSPSSYGFCNTRGVYVFESRKSRDVYVRESPDLGVETIKKSEITRYLSSTYDYKPFTGRRWVIREDIFTKRPDGCIGEVEVATYDEYYRSKYITPLFR